VPLILDPGAHTLERLRRMFIEQRDGLLETAEYLEQTPVGARRDPASFRTAEDLLRDAHAMMLRIDPASADAATLAAATNLAYSVMLSAIDLRKSHTDGPTVPQGPPARAAASEPR
jgi:hypothetical protein